ncbi:hypothetical protein D779_1023 [Imhoffiella purpurea]|uniref:Uncharacterized protein n=1 Tax=Imhoffiella purpurea TaxID=1249627 RepID=W9V8N8_9GAMM|nr:hypothetical protein D779_1023 [Imhoffiella purpurea]
MIPCSDRWVVNRHTRIVNSREETAEPDPQRSMEGFGGKEGRAPVATHAHGSGVRPSLYMIAYNGGEVGHRPMSEAGLHPYPREHREHRAVRMRTHRRSAPSHLVHALRTPGNTPPLSYRSVRLFGRCRSRAERWQTPCSEDMDKNARPRRCRWQLRRASA